MAPHLRNGLALLLAALASACTAQVASELDEPEANRIVLALERGGIAAKKESEGGGAGKLRVTVAEDDVGPALARLDSEGLLRASGSSAAAEGEPSALEGLVASRARAAQGAAHQLRRSLESVDGVVSARVHVGAPDRDAFSRAEQPATASVLLEHRGAEPPLAVDAVQRLVAGGFPGLAPERVSVVLVARPAGALPGAEATFARVGPLVVARGSQTATRLTFGALLLVIAAFAATTLALATRLAATRRRQAMPEARP